MARGTYIYPPRPSMRLITDTFAYCAERLPNWNSISISGYHIREAGSTAVQEIAFTLADGIAYVEAALAAGLGVDAFAPRLSFFWNAHNNLFEEVAKYRAARRMWAQDHDRALRRPGRAVQAPALPHPDRGVDPHRPAAREQHRARHPPGARCGPGRDPEPAHQRLRRGPRAAHHERGQDRAAHPAGDRLRVRRARHRRPAGGLVLRRAAHRRGREGGVGLPRPYRRPGRGRGRHRGPFHAGRDRDGRLRVRQGASTTARRSSWA